MYEIKPPKLHSTAQMIYQIVGMLLDRSIEPSTDTVTKIMYLTDKQMVLEIGRRTSSLQYMNKNNHLHADLEKYCSVQNQKTGEFTYYFTIHKSGVLERNLDLDSPTDDLTRRSLEYLKAYSRAKLPDLAVLTNDFAFKYPRPDGVIELTSWFAELNTEARFTLIDYIATETYDGFNL